MRIRVFLTRLHLVPAVHVEVLAEEVSIFGVLQNRVGLAHQRRIDVFEGHPFVQVEHALHRCRNRV